MIGVYVHHRGRGHLHRVLPVIRALEDEVTVLTAAPIDPAELPDGTRVVRLPADGLADPAQCGADAAEASLAARRAAVAWIDRTEPDAFWVDSSPEMALAARMTGAPVVSTLAPGSREDEPHLLGCLAAEELLGAWPPGAHEDTVARTGHRVAEIGGVSRFEHRPRAGGAGSGSGTGGRRRGPRVVHLNSSGGVGDHRFWRAVRSTVLRLGVADWQELGGPDAAWHPDPWEALSTADVVVTSGGQSSIADAACADVPLVVVPEWRPYGEHDATAAALEGVPGATVRRFGDGPTLVADAVRRQVERARDGEVSGIRERWRVDGAASRAASVLTAVARAS